ncbi:MAG: YggT family protein [Burkholderiales bacterium]
MAAQALTFLIETILGLFSLTLLIRFYLQLARIPPRNPISQFAVALTDPVVRPARRVIPGWAGLDLSTLVLAWITEFAQLVLTRLVLSLFVDGIGLPVLGFALLAVISVVRLSLYILMGALVVQAILSWVAPFSPIAPVVNGLTRPFIRPIQQRLPPIGNVDLSPLVLLIALQLVLMVPVNWFTGLVVQIFGG